MIIKKKAFRRGVDEEEYLYVPEGLKKFCVPIGSVKLFEKNPRRNDRHVKDLAELIKTNLFRKPIVVDQNGVIRAGNTAYKAAVSLGMKMIPVAQSDFTDEELAVKYVISDNKAGEWSGWDEDVLKHIFMHDLSSVAGTGFSESDKTKLFKVDEIEKRRAEMAELGSKRGASALFTVEQGDIRTWKSNGKQFDFIITDPPYPAEYLDLWEVLAKRAAEEWLKPNGVLVALSGNMYLDKIHKMLGAHLNYMWTCSIYYAGNIIMPLYPVVASQKPMLVFTKVEAKKYRGRTFRDSYICKKEDGVGVKDLHHWGQGVAEFSYYVKQMCEPGMSILDPFLGSGTTGIACLENGMYFTGVDIEQKNVDISRERLAAYEFVNKAQGTSAFHKINKTRADGAPF